MVWHLDVVFVHRFAIESQIVGFLLILGLEKVPRVAHFIGLISAVFAAFGTAVRRLKWHASWVQNVARQFGPYLLWAFEV